MSRPQGRHVLRRGRRGGAGRGLGSGNFMPKHPVELGQLTAAAAQLNQNQSVVEKKLDESTAREAGRQMLRRHVRVTFEAGLAPGPKKPTFAQVRAQLPKKPALPVAGQQLHGHHHPLSRLKAPVSRRLPVCIPGRRDAHLAGGDALLDRIVQGSNPSHTGIRMEQWRLLSSEEQLISYLRPSCTETSTKRGGASG